jgi:hypothetical protein
MRRHLLKSEVPRTRLVQDRGTGIFHYKCLFECPVFGGYFGNCGLREVREEEGELTL